MTVAREEAPAHMITMITKLATGIDLMTDIGGVMNSRKSLNLYERQAHRMPVKSPRTKPRVILRKVKRIDSQNLEFTASEQSASSDS